MKIKEWLAAGRFRRFPTEERAGLDAAYAETMRAARRTPGFVTGMVILIGLIGYFVLRSQAPGPITWEIVRIAAGHLLGGLVVSTIVFLVFMGLSRKIREDWRKSIIFLRVRPGKGTL